MPVGRGLMQMDRINIYSTSTAMDILETSPYTCGETVHFHVVVTNITAGSPTPTGTVNIFDQTSSTILNSGALAGGAVTIPVVLGASGTSYNFVAQYVGTVINPVFNPSTSSPPIVISTAGIGTNTVMNMTPSQVFCSYQGFLSGQVVATTTAVSGPTPTGTVNFRLYSNNTSFITLPAATLDGFGNAATNIAPSLVTGSPAGITYYLEGLYLGSGCTAPSASPNGTAGLSIIAVNNDVTSVSMFDSVGFGKICINTPINVTVNVASTLLSPPSSGTVTLTAYQVGCSCSYDTPQTLATATPSGGIALFPGVILPYDISEGGSGIGNGTWFFRAFYADSAGCYGSSSTQDGLDGLPVNVFDRTTATTTTLIVDPSSPADVTAGVAFNMTVTISTPGSIPPPSVGTVLLYRKDTIPTYPPTPDFPGSWTLIGSMTPSSGSAVFSVTVPAGAHWFIASYVGDGTCYNGSQSPETGNSTYNVSGL
jgi:hypothetical protein